MPTAAKKAATTAKSTAAKATPAKAATAKTTAPAADKGPRVIKAGGAKGEAIVALITKEPGLTRAQVAEKVGATTGRVGEVLRFFRDHGTTEQKALVAKHASAQPARKVATKSTTPTEPARGNSAKAAPAKKAATPRKRTAPTTTPSE